VIAKVQAEAAERARISEAERLSKARWLWSQRRPIVGSVAETYLRAARGYGGGGLPSTLGFLPARGKHGPAMIAAFGFPEEPEPGELVITDRAVRAVHLTRLLPDGSDRERGEAAKLMIGVVRGSPIVLAPVNDLGGLAIVEGIEDGLTVFEATGLGVWVAGAASFMPALADRIPAYVEAVTIYAHDDQAGQSGAASLAKRLVGRGLEVFVEQLR
jgi:Toprim domain